jgi:TPR repeat protein
MCTEIVFVSALALTMIWPAFTPSQSPSSAVVPNSRASQIDLKKLTKKANSGDTAAQFKFGYAYHFGVGVDKNVYQAIEWYRKAANHGDPAAQTNLGYVYETGPEAAKDFCMRRSNGTREPRSLEILKARSISVLPIYTARE